MSSTDVPDTNTDDSVLGKIGKIWRDKKSRSIIMQILVVAVIIFFVSIIISNAKANIDTLGVKIGFDFLWQNAGYDIDQTLIDYDSSNSHFRAGLVGVLNTLLVAFCGVILATILGFTAGVARLSNNFVINRLMQVYIEAVRNVPVLLQILLIYGIFLHTFPVPRRAGELIGGAYFTNRGLYLPQPMGQDGSGWIWVAFFAALIGAYLFRGYAKKVLEKTGKQLPVLWVGLGLIIGLPLLTYFITGMPIELDYPVLKRTNFKGGFVVRPEFLALWLALSIYTGAFIAEIVRAGILSVNKGQSEAAHALGIKPGKTMSLVVIPQAMRVIIPPLISQYLNLTKNSSLAVAIGYSDIVATIGGTTMNQTGNALECMAIVLTVYLVISLIISTSMNIYNRRTKLIER